MHTYQGTIIENSLSDRSVLDVLFVTKTWTDEDWILHDVEVKEELFPLIQKALADGPWYVHVWRGNEMIIIFRDTIFKVDRFDTSTWKVAIEHGLSKGIPKEQLDFLTE